MSMFSILSDMIQVTMCLWIGWNMSGSLEMLGIVEIL